MNEENYNNEIGLAAKFKDSGDYSEARRHYRKAITFAPPDKLQEIINSIKEMNDKIKVEAPAKKQIEKEVNGFVRYDKTFNDVIGYKKHKKLARTILERSLTEGNLLGWFKIPKSTGILLYGPPGTGKTLFAKSLSGEFKIPMKDVQINEILDKLVGGSEKNMAKVFEDAKEMQPCILFFDELDALGASRESSNEFTSNDIKNTINVFLKQTSELHDNKEMRVFVIGATNLPWMIDDAIKRSGRLEHFIYIRPPTFLERRRLFEYYLEMRKGGNNYGKGISLSLLSLATIRYSQADIESVVIAAKRVAEEKGKKFVTTRDVQKAIKEKRGETLDNWYLTAKTTYLKSEKERVTKTGPFGLIKHKEIIQEQGKLSKDELKIYKPLINNINSTMRWWGVFNIVRFVARGI